MSSPLIDHDKRLIAILRGITSDDVPAIIHRLIDCGFRAIEIPLNSPEALTSIEIATQIIKSRLGAEALIGAGTVTDAKEVELVAKAGGNLIVSPHIDGEIIAKAHIFGLKSYPGVFTATEAFTAIKAGATGLKLFPASLLGVSGIKALKAVLPAHVPLYAVGGVGADDFAAYAKAGVTGFGLGTSLYSQGMSADDVEARAHQAIRAMIDAYQG